jgi:hypothetical protein
MFMLDRVMHYITLPISLIPALLLSLHHSSTPLSFNAVLVTQSQKFSSVINSKLFSAMQFKLFLAAFMAACAVAAPVGQPNGEITKTSLHDHIH